MKLNALRDFATVAEKGSLRAAARQLGMTQPAISRSIQELERELGIALFERRARGVMLTRLGEIFLRRVSRVHSELRVAREELDQLRGSVNGRLTLALSSVAHIALLPGALKPFRERYPDVTMEIIDAVYPNVEADLRDGRIDCYVGPAPSDATADLLVEELFGNRRLILCRKGHPLAHARSLRELVGASWITTSITYKAEEEIGPLFAQHGLPPPRLVMQAHSTLTFLTAMVSSDLLMLLPVQWVQSPLLRDAVVAIPVAESLPAPPMCIVRRTGLPLTPAGEYFCDMIRRSVPQAQRDIARAMGA